MNDIMGDILNTIINICLFIFIGLIFWYLYLLISTIHTNLKKIFIKKLFKEREE